MKLHFVSLVGLAPLLLVACPPPASAPPDVDAECQPGVTFEAKKCPPCDCDAGQQRPGAVDAGAPDAGFDLAARACSNMRAIKCSDGLARDCEPVLRAVLAHVGEDGKPLFRVDPSKLETVKTIAAARAAGASCQ